LTATVFWDRKGVLMVKFMQQRTTTTPEVYCEILTKLHRVIQKKGSGILTSGALLLHHNACPHAATCIRALLEHLNWELFGYPPYRPHLAPSDYHLFTYQKNWLRSQAAGFLGTGIQRLNSRHDKGRISGLE
jgi:transposase